MRVKLKLNGQETIEGADARQVVQRMRELEFSVERTTDIRAYMLRVRDRVKALNGKQVGVASYDQFLTDLQSAGLLEILN